MKKIILYSALFSTVAFASCKKFLDTLPDNRTTLNTPGKVAEMLVSAYPRASYIAFCEAMSDNADDKGSANSEVYNAIPYVWGDSPVKDQDTPDFYWNGTYNAIASANQALDAISQVDNPKAYTAQRGEALVARAYAHFMLVTLYSKAYDPATAASDPGIPYVTTPEKVVLQNYERKTVSYVYEMIEKDLTEGLPLLNDASYKIPAYHFTEKAAHAFAARFYLFKQDYPKVVEHASLVFPDNNFRDNMRDWLGAYDQYTYQELLAAYTKASDPANLLLAEAETWWGRSYPGYRYGLSTALYEKVFGGNVTGGSWIYGVYGDDEHLNVPKFNEYFVREGLNANTGLGYNMIPLFTTEEVLLNRAEAYARQANYTAALADINVFASGRIINFTPARMVTETKAKNFYNTTDIKVALINSILDFKRTEFMHEGLRWLDIVRLKLPVVHNTESGKITLSPTDPRRLSQMPQEVKLAGLELNPR
jgi:hypothetical protein